MTNRAADWLRQAEADLKHARTSLEHDEFEWSCFASQQAAEKAVKAVYFHLRGDPWGHSLLSLLGGLRESAEVTPALLDAARSLDKQYIPTRYPNGFAEGAPTDYYTRRDAEESIRHAESVLSFCQAALHQPPSDPGDGPGDGGEDQGGAS
jgi:HEPN domain-containing protein